MSSKYFSNYLVEIGNVALLSPEREIELSEIIQRGLAAWTAKTGVFPRRNDFSRSTDCFAPEEYRARVAGHAQYSGYRSLQPRHAISVSACRVAGAVVHSGGNGWVFSAR
jgi:hypothetical protein